MPYSQTLTPNEPPNGSTNQPLIQSIGCNQSGYLLPWSIYLNGQLKASYPQGNMWKTSWNPPSVDEEHAEGSSHSWYFHYAYYADSRQWVDDHWEFGGLVWTDTPTWSFTTCTIPHAAIVNPGNGATGQGFSVNLIWDKPTIGPDGNPCTCDWVDVWFSKASEPLVKVRSQYTGTATQRINLEENTTYKWRVDPHIVGWGRGTGEEWTFTTGQMPSKVSNPSPANGADPVVPDEQNPFDPLRLSWSPAAPKPADTYDVWFGEKGSMALFSAGQTGTYIDIDWGSLTVSTEYEWRIDSVNNVGTTTGDVWSFKTGDVPSKPTNPKPADMTTEIECDRRNLSWDASSPIAADNYDVWFGQQGNMVLVSYAQEETVWDIPSDLAFETVYEWAVVARNTVGITAGDIWAFATKVEEQEPPDMQTMISFLTPQTFSWPEYPGATAYDVYFGKYPNLVYIGRQATREYTPPLLSCGTKYIWRIDAVINDVVVDTGQEFTCTTVPCGRYKKRLVAAANDKFFYEGD